MESLNHTLQLTSYGGAGTSSFYKFLKKEKLDVPLILDAGSFKHMKAPPATPSNPNYKVKEDFKVVYLFGNPMDTTISLFSRGYHTFHLKRMGYSDDKIPGRMKLQQYLAEGVERFKFDNHFTTWTEAPLAGRSYPILIVKYETMWDNLEEIFNFIGLPHDKVGQFPKQSKRKSNWEKQQLPIKKGLLSMYGALYEKTKNHPEIKLI